MSQSSQGGVCICWVKSGHIFTFRFIYVFVWVWIFVCSGGRAIVKMEARDVSLSRAVVFLVLCTVLFGVLSGYESSKHFRVPNY